jgi:hypothetical protein
MTGYVSTWNSTWLVRWTLCSLGVQTRKSGSLACVMVLILHPTKPVCLETHPDEKTMAAPDRRCTAATYVLPPRAITHQHRPARRDGLLCSLPTQETRIFM